LGKRTLLDACLPRAAGFDATQRKEGVFDMKRSLFIAVCVSAVLLLPMNASAATVTPFTATTTETGGSPGWAVPGVDPSLMPSGCCQYRDAVLNLTWSGDIVGTSVIVFSRAADNIWGTETLTTADGTWENSIQGKIIPGYGFVGQFVGHGPNGATIQGTVDLNVVQGEIRTP
jgi:hypothetical protein